MAREGLRFTDFHILPTFAELAGSPVPAGLDGISFAPVLRGRPRARDHEYLYWDYPRTVFQQAVRSGDWKAIRNGREFRVELYDLATDIGESRDVAAAHPDVVARLAGLMERAYVPSPDYPLSTPRKR